MIPFVGYAPDVSPETPGIFLDCDQIIPDTNGFKAQGSALDVGIDALSGQARGFAVVKKLDNTNRIFAATRTTIEELSSTTWTDVSAVGGYDLGVDSEGCARFAQFGNVTIASVGHNNYIQSSTSGDFAAIALSPKAKIIETINNFVFAFNFVDSNHGLGTLENGWWCCALGDETDWAPSVTTQCVAGSFLQTAGEVVAAKKLGSYIVAYKEQSAFLGQYVGVPEVWNWSQLPGQLGALSQECVVDVGTAHYFISRDDFQMFDGSRFTPIGTPVRQTFFADLEPQYRNLIKSMHDRTNSLIYWFYPSISGGGTIDKCIVYNYKKDQWGRSDITIEAACEYTAPGVTFEGIGSLYSTWDDLPTNIGYDSQYWTVESPSPAFIKTDHKINTFGASPGDSYILTGHYGDVSTFSTVQKIRPRFVVSPTSSTLDYYHSNENADNMTQNISSTLTNNVYDLIWSARWHQVKLNFTGPMTISGFTPEFMADGNE